jgi:hypothetical protein
MRSGAVLLLLGITAFGAYSVGRQSAPVSNAPVPAITSSSAVAQPVTFIGPAPQPSTPAPVPSSSGGPTPSTKAALPDKPAAPDTKRKVEAGLTAAAIAAIIVQASRDQYHAGGQAPRLSGWHHAAWQSVRRAQRVTAAMIESYRQRQRGFPQRSFWPALLQWNWKG